MVVATPNVAETNTEAIQFQSLAGFLGRCDLNIYDGFGMLNWFQSLAGFLGRCDLDSDVLIYAHFGSFNPWRVFLVVATAGAASITFDVLQFQSLAGSLGRCDVVQNA